MSGIPRSSLVASAFEKRDAAVALLDAGHFSSSYYLAGYAVELILKARVAAFFEASTLPDPKFVRAIYTHDLERLVSLAGLTAALNSALSTDREIAADWLIVKAWGVEARYGSYNEQRGRRLIEAVGDRERGMLGWFNSYRSGIGSSAAEPSFAN